jgi:hypothetical protein
MNRLHRTFIVTLAFAGSVDAATPRVTTINNALESQASAIVLPSGPGSTLVVTLCVGCRPVSYRATALTHYLLNEKIVPLGEFKSALATHPKLPVTVVYSVKSLELVRVQAYVDIANRSPR